MKFASLFSVVKDNSSVFFYLKPLYFVQKFSNFWVVAWKFTKFKMSYLKLQVNFTLNFASLFSLMRNNSSVLFELRLYMIWTKEAHQSTKFQTFDCSGKISPNLYLDRLLLLKVYKILDKKVKRSCVSWPWRLMQNLRKNWSVVSKMTKIWWNLTRTLESLKNSHFHLFLSWKVFNV